MNALGWDELLEVSSQQPAQSTGRTGVVSAGVVRRLCGRGGVVLAPGPGRTEDSVAVVRRRDQPSCRVRRWLVLSRSVARYTSCRQ